MVGKDKRPRASTINAENVAGLRGSIGQHPARSDSKHEDVEEQQEEHDEDSDHQVERQQQTSSSYKDGEVSKQALSQFEDEDWRENVDGVINQEQAAPNHTK